MRRLAIVLIPLLILGLVIGVGCDEGNGTATPTVTPTLTATPTPSVSATATPGTTNTEDGVLPQLQVHFIDVGQGDAILLDLGETEVLIDGGKKTSAVISSLSSCLGQNVDGNLEAMIATHPHYDHVGGLVWVLDNYDVDQIWYNADTDQICGTCEEFRQKAAAEVDAVGVARRGQIITVGELSFNILHPYTLLSGDINNDSIVLALTYGNIDFLFAGDAEHEAEGSMLVQSIVPLPEVEILKVGHHGSRTACSVDFLNACQPEITIYMAGGEYGHPHQETITALQDIGVEIYGTDVNGTIVVTTDGVSYTVETTSTTEVTPTPTPTPTLKPTPTPTPVPIPTPTLTPTSTYISKDYCASDCQCYSYKLDSDIQCSQAGAICKDGTCSTSTGSGTCSWHGGVKQWINCP